MWGLRSIVQSSIEKIITKNKKVMTCSDLIETLMQTSTLDEKQKKIIKRPQIINKLKGQK